jgi:hypothetical protein
MAIIAKKRESSTSYIARNLIIATFPHSKPKSCNFSRRNGNHILSLYSPPEFGLPYGSIPRIILIWVCTEAVLKKKKEISLGKSLNKFLKSLGFITQSLRRKEVKEQMRRLIATRITYIYADNDKKTSLEHLNTFSKANILWSATGTKEESYITLSDEFYKELIKRAVPICFKTINNLKKSPLAIDIYCWLTYRMSYLSRKTEITWVDLQKQFGGDYASTINGRYEFKRNFSKQMLKVLKFYPDAKVMKTNDGIMLSPSKTHISKLVDK